MSISEPEAPSEDEYWEKIKAYNADGSYAYPPPPINADQVYDFWSNVFVPDEVLHAVRRRDIQRHTDVEERIHTLTTRWRTDDRHPARLLPPLTPDALQRKVDILASRRRYRRHPELLERTQEAKDLKLAHEQINALVASVPPRRIPVTQLRTAARIGKLYYNAQRLSESEWTALGNYTVLFMGERQTISRMHHTWRPHEIV